MRVEVTEPELQGPQTERQRETFDSSLRKKKQTNFKKRHNHHVLESQLGWNLDPPTWTIEHAIIMRNGTLI